MSEDKAETPDLAGERVIAFHPFTGEIHFLMPEFKGVLRPVSDAMEMECDGEKHILTPEEEDMVRDAIVKALARAKRERTIKLKSV
jgi:hypothetical protein